jgi:hypothetical protein
MRRDDYIDFHAVEPAHVAIHERLVNWGRWANGGNTPATAPGFSLYRSPARARGAEHESTRPPVDGADACRVQSVVGTLPMLQRSTLAWCYIKPTNPQRFARHLQVSLDHLAWLLRDGRQRLINQGA